MQIKVKHIKELIQNLSEESGIILFDSEFLCSFNISKACISDDVEGGGSCLLLEFEDKGEMRGQNER